MKILSVTFISMIFLSACCESQPKGHINKDVYQKAFLECIKELPEEATYQRSRDMNTCDEFAKFAARSN